MPDCPHSSRRPTLRCSASSRSGGTRSPTPGLSRSATRCRDCSRDLRVLDISENRLTRYGLGLLEEARKDLPVALDVSGNVQASTGQAPVPVGEVVTGVLRDAADAAEAAELRRRVSHPTFRPGDRNIPPG